jgi:hypothetical protein
VIVDPARTVLDARFDDDGRIALRIATAEGTEEATLAGVVRGASAAAPRALRTVRDVASAAGACVVVLRADGAPATASLFLPARRLDVSAELLRRGVLPLDLARRDVLAQQPTLVIAAFLARRDAHLRDAPALADPAYRAALDAVVAR